MHISVRDLSVEKVLQRQICLCIIIVSEDGVHKGAESGRGFSTPFLGERLLFLNNKGRNMAKYTNQKAKILFLQQMMYDTGEGRTLSMQQILEQLQEKGIRAERKSIYDDMDVLRYFGMDIAYSRERPSGYYLKGNISVERSAVPASDLPGNTDSLRPEPEGQKPEGQKPDPDYWLQFLPGADREKQMKLLCTKEGVSEAVQYFGDACQYKKKEEGIYSVTAPLMETDAFFGWLTSMNQKVHLQKPKKTSQLYRDYLKNIAKGYKTDK